MKKAIVAIAAILVVGGAGFTGWRLKQSRSERTHTEQTKTTNQITTQNNNQPPSNPEGGKYLPIKEWAVKIPLSNDLNGATYQYKAGIVYVTTPGIQAVPGCKDVDILSIQRAHKGEFIGPSTVDELLANNPDSVTKHGEYYYGVIASPNDCVDSQTAADNATLSSAKTALERAVRQIQDN